MAGPVPELAVVERLVQPVLPGLVVETVVVVVTEAEAVEAATEAEAVTEPVAEAVTGPVVGDRPKDFVKLLRLCWAKRCAKGKKTTDSKDRGPPSADPCQ